jgi:hypothetical protein
VPQIENKSRHAVVVIEYVPICTIKVGASVIVVVGGAVVATVAYENIEFIVAST